MPGIIRCPGCGQEIDANSRFCVHCTTRICPGCHGPIPPRAIFCPICGFSVGPAVPGASEHQPPVPPPMSFTPSQGGIVGPQPRQFTSSQGGIIGPQPGQPPPYYEPPGTVPGTPIPQPMPTQQYGTADQQSGPYGSPGGVPYAGVQQPSATDRRFRDTGPIRVRRRLPPVLLVILIVAAIGLAGFGVYKVGWVSNVEKFVSGINLPEWLPFGNKDTVCPTIQNVSVSNVNTDSAIVKWQTDEPSTSQVMICESGSSGGGSCTWTELDENLVTDHSVNVINLKPDTAYHFTATSTDSCANQGTAEGDFKTLSEVTTVSLIISGINVSNITELASTISWITDKPATSQVAYGTTTAYESNTTLNQTLDTNHNTTLSGLIPGTTYHFKVISNDGSGNDVASLDQTFTTRSAVPASTEVGYKVGNLAPDFTLPTLDDKQVSLKDFRGKLVMINFWQDVQQSRNELSLVQEIYATWPRDKLEVLAVSWKQNKAIAQAIATSKGLTFPILLDETGSAATKYNITQCPVTIFIDSQGIIRATMYYPATLKNITQVESILNSMQ